MTHQEIINEWNGRVVGDGECVIWAAQFSCQRYNVCYLPTPVTGGARDIWEQNTVGQYFDRVSNTPNNVPPQGSLVYGGAGLGNYYGHIGVATGEGNSSYFTSYDSNWNGKTVQKINHNYNNVLGWLVPKGASMQLADNHPYQMGVTKRSWALLSNEQEAQAVGVNLDPSNVKIMYANDFIKIDNGKKIYQAITSELAYNLICGDNNYGRVKNVTTANIDEVAKLQKRIVELEKQLAEAPTADTVAKDTNSKVTDIWNWIKSIFNR